MKHVKRTRLAAVLQALLAEIAVAHIEERYEEEAHLLELYGLLRGYDDGVNTDPR